MSPENPLDTHPHPHRQRGDTYIGIVIGALAALIVLVVVVVVVVYLRHRRNKYNNSSPLKNPMLGVDHVNFNLNDLTPGLSSGKLLNGNMYNSVSTTDAETEKEPLQPAVSSDVYREPCDSIQCRRLPELPAHLSLSKRTLLASTRDQHTQQTRHMRSMADQCWADVVDGGPTLVRHWVHASYLLGSSGSNTYRYKIPIKHKLKMIVYCWPSVVDCGQH